MTQAAIGAGRPVKAIAMVTNAAPTRIRPIRQLVRTAPNRLSRNVSHESVPVAAASTRAPTTPITAASVGVAMPP